MIVSLLFPQFDEFSEEEEDEEDDEEEESDDSNTRLESRNAAILNGNNRLQQGRKDSFNGYSKTRETVGSLGFNGQRKVWFVLPLVFCVF